MSQKWRENHWPEQHPTHETKSWRTTHPNSPTAPLRIEDPATVKDVSVLLLSRTVQVLR